MPSCSVCCPPGEAGEDRARGEHAFETEQLGDKNLLLVDLRNVSFKSTEILCFDCPLKTRVLHRQLRLSKVRLRRPSMILNQKPGFFSRFSVVVVAHRLLLQSELEI